MTDLARPALQPELTARLSAPADVRGAGGGLSRHMMRRWAKNLVRGTLDIVWPDGTSWRHVGRQPGPGAQIHVNNPRIVRRVLFGGALGFADSYADGDWDSPDLTALLKLGIDNETALADILKQSAPFAALCRLRHRGQANSVTGSRRNIAAHYDLGNDFYAAWLDDTMTYSAGLFAGVRTSLSDAQDAKFARIAKIAGIQRGEHILEIGCGWGGFALYAARHFDCRVTALTLSTEQAEWARRAVADAGLDERVEIRIEDYRHVTGIFDRIVSIEMFEAVGEAYWPEYFATLRARLRPGGRAALQVITIDDARYERYRQRPDFIQMRIFPGGMLPSPSRFAKAAKAHGLSVIDAFDFGPSYAETLRHWRRRFDAGWPQVERLGFDEKFRRLWRYYWCYCETGFDTGTISVAHYRLDTV